MKVEVFANLLLFYPEHQAWATIDIHYICVERIKLYELSSNVKKIFANISSKVS